VGAAVPLSRSPRLQSISEQAAALARLYGRGPLYRTIDDTRWRFQWRCIAGSLLGVEVRLRIGGAQAVLGLENLGPFGSAISVTRPEVPAALRSAYLGGLGAVVWQELEALTRHAIEVLDVQLDSIMSATPECLGFELGHEPSGPATRGLLRLTDPDIQRNAQLVQTLAEASGREMAPAPLQTQLRLRWAAVVGCTKLSVAEVGALEEHDIVLIDDPTRAAKMLGCWLGVGPARRYAGRAMLRNGGLQMVQFGTGGDTSMTSSDVAAARTEESGLDEIPVNLRFELAQWSASLGEVGGLAPGALIDLGQRIDEHSVTVWIEQRCIGKGQLVAIGERLGVRLLSVFASQSACDAQRSTAASAVPQST
jgi:type III secretion protein Q